MLFSGMLSEMLFSGILPDDPVWSALFLLEYQGVGIDVLLDLILARTGFHRK